MRLTMVALVVGGIAACGGAPPKSAPVVASAVQRHVVVVSIDGLRADVLRDLDAAGLKVPTLRKLVAEGARAEGVRSVWPTVTYPAHATLVTGVRPTKHGILNNGPFDPTGENLDGWSWYASDLRAPALWDVARARGLTTANVYWPVTVGAPIDWSFPQIWRAKNDEDDKLMRVLATPGLADEVRARYGRTPAEHRGDDARAEAAEHLLETKRPALSFVYLTDLDTIAHAHGPDSAEAKSTLETIDALLARIVAATERGGYRARTTFVIVSDHGFRSIEKIVRPAVLLRAAGLLEVSGGRITSYRAAPWKAGGSCAIVLKDPNDAASRAAVKKLFSEAAANPASGIAAVRDGDEIAAQGGFAGAAVVLEARDGFAFSAGVEGGAVDVASERGAHGYAPDRSEMQAVLVVSGAGAREGAKLPVVDMIDVAPTVAKLLGIELAGAEGHALDAALAP